MAVPIPTSTGGAGSAAGTGATKMTAKAFLMLDEGWVADFLPLPPPTSVILFFRLNPKDLTVSGGTKWQEEESATEGDQQPMQFKKPQPRTLKFKILVDIVASARRQVRFAEVPYTFRNRERGESKLDLLVGLEYLQLLLDKLIGNRVPTRFLLFAAVGLAYSAGSLVAVVSSLASVSADDVNIAAVRNAAPAELVVAESPPTRSARSLVSSRGSGSLMNWV